MVAMDSEMVARYFLMVARAIIKAFCMVVKVFRLVAMARTICLYAFEITSGSLATIL